MAVEASNDEASQVASTEDMVRRLLDVARVRTGMEIAWVSRFGETDQELTVVSEDGSCTIAEGTTTPVAGSYCTRVLDGRLPSVVRDAAADPETRDLQVTAQLGIGSYIGVPLRGVSGAVTGMLCAIGPDANEALGSDDVRFLELLAEVAADLLRDVPVSRDRRRRLRDRVGRVISHQLLTCVFQPIVDVELGRTVGFEALSRFPAEPKRPDLWFANAESVGLGVALEMCAVRTAISAMSTLPEGAYLSVNLSPAALLSIDTDELMAVQPGRLVVELTEHREVDDYPRLRDVVGRLRAAGIRLAVDDAGAGFSSFKHILELDPDIVKIDLSISQHIHADPARQALVRGMVEIAQQIPATLVAEGVEDVRDLDRLRQLGVSLFQGYLLGRPAPTPVNGDVPRRGPDHDSSTPMPVGAPSEGELHIETALMNTAVPSAIVEPDGTLRSVNTRLAELLGRDVSDVVGRTFQELTHPDDLGVDLEHLRQCLDGRRDSYRISKRYIGADGQSIPTDLIVTVVRGRDRRARYFISHVIPL